MCLGIYLIFVPVYTQLLPSNPYRRKRRKSLYDYAESGDKTKQKQNNNSN